MAMFSPVATSQSLMDIFRALPRCNQYEISATRQKCQRLRALASLRETYHHADFIVLAAHNQISQKTPPAITLSHRENAITRATASYPVHSSNHLRVLKIRRASFIFRGIPRTTGGQLCDESQFSTSHCVNFFRNFS